MTPNQNAFLDMLAFSEGTCTMPGSDNGYNVIVGCTLFHSYADHPRVLVTLKDRNGNPIIDKRTGKPLRSTAAGRYQLLQKYFDAYKKQLGLPDFSPASQDAIALQQIKEQGALADIEAGRFAEAVRKCKNIWASLPGAGYGQHENSLDKLQAAFIDAGGKLA